MVVIRVEKKSLDEAVKALDGCAIKVVRQPQRDLIRVDGEVDITKLPDGSKLLDQDFPFLDWKVYPRKEELSSGFAGFISSQSGV